VSWLRRAPEPEPGAPTRLVLRVSEGTEFEDWDAEDLDGPTEVWAGEARVEFSDEYTACTHVSRGRVLAERGPGDALLVTTLSRRHVPAVVMRPGDTLDLAVVASLDRDYLPLRSETVRVSARYLELAQ
jgi:hypothetical protein